ISQRRTVLRRRLDMKRSKFGTFHIRLGDVKSELTPSSGGRGDERCGIADLFLSPLVDARPYLKRFGARERDGRRRVRRDGGAHDEPSIHDPPTDFGPPVWCLV